MNQGHGSDGSGLVRVWWRLAHCSAKANTFGRNQPGLWYAQTKAQAEVQGRRQHWDAGHGSSRGNWGSKGAAVEAPGHAGREGRGGDRMRSDFENSSPV